MGITSAWVYEGGTADRFEPDAALPDLSADSTLFRDIERFTAFSDEYVAIHPDRNNVLGDVRYSMKPTSLIPLWGIEMDFEHPKNNVRWLVFRELSQAGRAEFRAMLLGRDRN